MKGTTRETVAAKLRTLRQQAHLEQEMVARALDVPRTAIVAIESGKRDVTAIELCNLCKIYRTSPNEILNFKDKYAKGE